MEANFASSILPRWTMLIMNAARRGSKGLPNGAGDEYQKNERNSFDIFTIDANVRSQYFSAVYKNLKEQNKLMFHEQITRQLFYKALEAQGY